MRLAWSRYLALASALKRSELRLSSNVVFIGNVGEEGEGDLRGMRHLFASSPWKETLQSLLVIDGAGTDTYVTQALGSRRFEMTFRGPGGHSWSDFGIPNPILLLSRALARFSEGEVPQSPRTTFNVGVIQGGTSVNSIPNRPPRVWICVPLRKEELQRLEARLHECVNEAWSEVALAYRAGEAKVRFAIETIGDRPAAESARRFAYGKSDSRGGCSSAHQVDSPACVHGCQRAAGAGTGSNHDRFRWRWRRRAHAAGMV